MTSSTINKKLEIYTKLEIELEINKNLEYELEIDKNLENFESNFEFFVNFEFYFEFFVISSFLSMVDELTITTKIEFKSTCWPSFAGFEAAGGSLEGAGLRQGPSGIKLRSKGTV